MQYSNSRITRQSPYPRPHLVVIIRKIFLWSWSILLFYIPNVVWNLYSLFANLPPHKDYTVVFQGIFAALTLPGPLNSPTTPWWVYVLFVLLITLVVLGSIIARLDIAREKKHEGTLGLSAYDHVTAAVSGIGDVTQPLEPQVSYGPPFDFSRLPSPSPFVGRNSEVQWLMRRLRASKNGRMGNIAVLYGIAGIGKTGLAAKVIRDLHNEKRFRDGVAVHPCDEQRNATEVLERVLARFDAQRRLAQSTNLHDDIQRILDGKDALVVLDNVESDWPISEVIIPLREAGVSVLLITRHIPPADGIPLEARLKIEPLSPPEAYDFFQRMQGTSRNSNPLTTASAIINDLLATLQYHTLAIKVVGAYARHRDLETLYHDIAQDPRFVLSISDGQESDVIQKVFNKSIDLLPTDARNFFAALSVFPTAEFGRRAAAKLASDLGFPKPGTDSPIELLLRYMLLEVSFINTLPQEKDRERLRLHPFLYELAQDRFRILPLKMRKTIYNSIMTYYTDYTLDAPEDVLSADEYNIMGVITLAQERGEKAVVATLCATMRYFWYNRWRTDASKKYLPLGVEAAEEIAASKPEQKYRSMAATLELTYGRILQRIGQLAEAEKNLQKSIQYRLDAQDVRGEAEAYASLGQIAQQRGLLRDAEMNYGESLKKFRSIPNNKGDGMIQGFIGELIWRRGRLEEAQKYCQDGLALLREEATPQLLIHPLLRLGEIAQDVGRYSSAKTHYNEGLMIARAEKDLQGEGQAFFCLGNLALQQSSLQEALDHYQTASPLFAEVRDRRSEGWLDARFGEAIQKQSRNNTQEARHYYDKSLEIARDIEDKRGESWSLAKLGGFVYEQGQSNRAERYFRDALDLARQMDDIIYYAQFAFAFGLFLIEGQGNRPEGCDYLKQAQNYYTRTRLVGLADVQRAVQKYTCN